MNIDDYKNLYEIQSLDLKVKSHLDVIAEEERRIVFVGKQAKKREESFEVAKESHKALKEQIKHLESELYSLQKELDRARAHLNDATNSKQLQGLENEIKALSPKEGLIETELFGLMEKEEELMAQLDKDKNYLSGVSGTLSDIEKEVEQVRLDESGKVEILEERIRFLLDQTNPDLLPSFNQARKKHRFDLSLSTIQGNSCARCKYEVPSAIKEQIERMFCIEICAGCGRLLTPLNARS